MVSVENEYDQKSLTNQRPARKVNSLELLPYISFKDSFENLEANQEIISSFTTSIHVLLRLKSKDLLRFQIKSYRVEIFRGGYLKT